MKIGVLALQGDFQEHCVILRKLGVEATEVRLPKDLENLDGLIIPGGESTTIGKLAKWYGLFDKIKEFAETKPIWGTCCGLVFMAREVGFDQPVLGVMDVVVERNAFGRQVDSFEVDIAIEGLEGGPFHGVFIRGPVIRKVGGRVKILSQLPDGRIVAVQQDHLLAVSFHPELTNDLRLHKYFISLIQSKK
jgi:pyridoxal 5'-phosphate synthase pdxT subunit